MNRHVNAIAGRLSLRKPQRDSLEILDRITEIVPPNKAVDLKAALEIIRSEFPTVTDFEREFPSLCFALATGVGKTRLMGAFISYLHLAHGMEDYLVRALVDFDDVSYDNHADLLYELAGQMVAHLKSYLKDAGEVANVLQYYHRQLAGFIHAQMQEHHWEKVTGHDVVVSKGFTALKDRAFNKLADEPIYDFRKPVSDKSRIGQMVFGGFKRGLYREEKFQSDTERVLSVILDREGEKWFKPGRGQFQIFYKWVADQREYQPDFVVETPKCIYMLEPKMRKEMEDPEVIAKKDSAVRWCQHATEHSAKNGGKPWKYLLIPHDAVAENMSITGLAAQFAVN